MIEEPAAETIVPEDPPPVDEKAFAEAEGFADRSLRNKHARSKEKHLHRGGIVLFWGAIIMVLATGIVWLLHLLLPEKWLFLSEHQRTDLQNVLVSAIGSAFVTQIARRWISPDE